VSVKDGPSGMPLPVNWMLPKFVTSVAVSALRLLGLNVIDSVQVEMEPKHEKGDEGEKSAAFGPVIDDVKGGAAT
jgi:hypothetical protein